MPPEKLALPFITRDMLAFNFAAKIELVTTVRSRYTDDLHLVGATKEGIFKYPLTPDGAGGRVTNRFTMTEMPIWISVIDLANNYDLGQIFARVELAINGERVLSLCAGYVGSTSTISWPATQNPPSAPNNEAGTSDQGSNPAAGVEGSVTVPAGEVWEVKRLSFTLVTDATVANRIVHVTFDPTGITPIDCISATAQTAGTTKLYSCYPTTPGGAAADDNDIIIPIPFGIFLNANDTIVTKTTGLVAGDNFTGIMVRYNRYYAV